MGPKSAGDLRQLISVQRRSASSDGYGNVEGEWANVIASRWAMLQPTRGAEQIIAGRAQGLSIWDCWVRYDSGTAAITPGDRVTDTSNGRTFNVTFAQDMTGNRTWILLQLQLGGADG